MSNTSALAATVCRDIDAAHGELIELCSHLVAAASVNPPGRTAEVADVVRGYLSGHGIAHQTVKADDEAPNVVAGIQGVAGGRHVVFNAHMDTMEAGDESAWSVPVMSLTRRDGRLYGLGMGNMKGALAAMCLATAVLNRHGNAWQGRLTMTAVSDEVMFGERGTVFLLRERPDLAGDFLISGEGPGFMGFAVAEKGLLWLDVEARGGGGHASRALHGETAVMRLSAFLARLDAMNDMYATLPPELAGVTGGDGNLGLRLSLNAGTIAAGTVRSQIAPRARAQIDIRLPPGISVEQCVAMIRRTSRCRHRHHGCQSMGRELDRARQPAGDRARRRRYGRSRRRTAVRRAAAGERRPALARSRHAGSLLWPATDALGRHRRLCQRAGRRRLRQDLCADGAGADGTLNG